MSPLNFDRFSDREPSPETPDDARLRRSRAVRSPRVRSLRRALARGADPSLAQKQWRIAGGNFRHATRVILAEGKRHSQERALARAL